MTAKPSQGVRLYYLDDAGILFSERRQELHLLNATATLIFTLLEEGCRVSEIVRTLCDGHAFDAASAARFVHASIATWRAQGFVDGEESLAAPAPSHAERLPDGPAWAEQRWCAIRHYVLLASRLALRFSSTAQADVVHPVLEHLAAPPQAATTTIDVIAHDRRLLVYRDRVLHGRCEDLDQLAPIVKSLVWTTVLRDQPYFLDIHAGVVSDGERCLLFPAAPGSGKSTLTAALAHAGYEFFSDEIALLDDDALCVLPVPLAICVKESGIAALAGRFPRLRSLDVHRRGDGKRVVYLPPPHSARHTTPRPVAALVFPRFAAGGPLSLAPLRKADALQRLLSQCLGVAPLDADRVERLVRWIACLPCYALTYGETDEAIDAVRSVLPASCARTAAVPFD